MSDVGRHHSDTRRREDCVAESRPEDDILASACASERRLTEPQLAFSIGVAYRAIAHGRVTAVHLAMTHMRGWPGDDTGESRKGARKGQWQDEREHDDVPDLPPARSHARKRIATERRLAIRKEARPLRGEKARRCTPTRARGPQARS